ncbi:MAG: polysaccharide deacetylase family protein [Gammaproteobacteria bacterium]
MQRPPRTDIIRRLSAHDSQTHLTFDDGPHPEYTPRVLDLLAAAGARATFFMVGTQAERHAGLTRRVLAAGHEVGNHTWSHAHPALLRAVVARHEVAAGSIALANVIGARPRYFRPPYGRMRRCMTEAAADQGQSVVLWSLSGKDWGPLGRARWIAERLARARAGDIVLLHDAPWRYNRPWEMLKVLTAFLSRLKRDGLTSETLERGVAGDGQVQSGAAKADRQPG